MAIGESSMALQIRGESSKVAASGFEGKKFPVGMRIVAVDDDQICLTMLNKLLSKCEYKVEALKMIRQNKDEIDLVITDVHMPEIDGFELLEIAGLELDLPVIMLSANDTKETVMKGIMHGACDYLIKPVRLEELSVIWKHVARRQKSLEEFEDAMNYNHATIGEDNAQAGQRGTPSGNRTRTCTGKRRKDDSDDDDSNDMENDGKSTKKKARVVWSPDLHRKFVNAVSEIGVDKAVPKSILEKMKIEKLTRENVASHLQKYRLYLKRLNANPNAFQAAFGSRSPFNIDLRSFERFKNFHTHGRYRQPVLNNSSPFHSARFNNTAMNPPNPSVMSNLAPSQMTQIGGGTGFTNAGTSNFNLTNNVTISNQTNLYKGVSGMSSFPGTSNSNYLNQVNNNTNYMSMTFPSPVSGPLPIAPFGYSMTNIPQISGTASVVGSQFGARPNLIGGNCNSGAGDRLQQAVSSFNTSWSMPNPNITGNLNNINCENLGSFFNNPANAPSTMSCGIGMSIGMGTGIGSGGMGTDIGSNGMGTGNVSGGMGMDPVNQGDGGFSGASFGTANSDADQPSSSSLQGGDDVSISGIDELLAAMLKPGGSADSVSFMDDDFFV